MTPPRTAIWVGRVVVAILFVGWFGGWLLRDFRTLALVPIALFTIWGASV